MAMAGPRFFGFVIGGALPATVAANWLATAWDQNAALVRAHRRRPRSSRAVALRWLLDVLRLPAGMRPAASSPAPRWRTSPRWPPRGTRVLARAGWDVEADGLFGAPPITVVVGDEVHATLLKALALLGLGRDARACACRSMAQGRMRADALPPHRRSDHRLPAGRQREHRRVRPVAAIVATGARRRRLGARRRRVRPVGARRAGARTSTRRRRAAPTPGRPTRTSGSTCPTTAASPSCATRRQLRAAMAITRRLPAARGARAQSVRLHARAVAPRARRRGLGGAALARPRRAGRPHRAQLPPRARASPTGCAPAATRS